MFPKESASVHLTRIAAGCSYLGHVPDGLDVDGGPGVDGVGHDGGASVPLVDHLVDGHLAEKEGEMRDGKGGRERERGVNSRNKEGAKPRGPHTHTHTHVTKHRAPTVFRPPQSDHERRARTPD